MRILIKEKYIDIEAPIYMSEQNLKKFIKGMKVIFGDRISVNKIIENKKEMGEVERQAIRFSEEDHLILGNAELSNAEVAKRLGKSLFAVQMKRGPFLMELQEWADKKDKNKITEKDIQEFLSEK